MSCNVEEQVFYGLDGSVAPAPGFFGVASEDINCRCTTGTRITGFSDEQLNVEMGEKIPANFEIYKQQKIYKK